MTRKVQSAVRSGLGEIGEAYPLLIQRALELALDEEEPDRQMLKFLIDLPLRFVPPDLPDDSPISQLVERITISRTTTRSVSPVSDEDSPAVVEGELISPGGAVEQQNSGAAVQPIQETSEQNG